MPRGVLSNHPARASAECAAITTALSVVHTLIAPRDPEVQRCVDFSCTQSVAGGLRFLEMTGVAFRLLQPENDARAHPTSFRSSPASGDESPLLADAQMTSVALARSTALPPSRGQRTTKGHGGRFDPPDGSPRGVNRGLRRPKDSRDTKSIELTPSLVASRRCFRHPCYRLRSRRETWRTHGNRGSVVAALASLFPGPMQERPRYASQRASRKAASFDGSRCLPSRRSHGAIAGFRRRTCLNRRPLTPPRNEALLEDTRAFCSDAGAFL